MLVEHQQQMAQESAAAGVLNEQIDPTVLPAADERIAKLLDLVRSAHELLLFSKNDNHSLQTRLDLLVDENSRLSRRLTEGKTSIDKLYSQITQLEMALRRAEAERDKLSAAINVANTKPEFKTSLQVGERRVQETEHSRSKLRENSAKILLAETVTF